MFGTFFTGALLMQRVYGYDAVETGLAFLPVSLSIGILSLGLSARLTTRFGASRVLVAGATLTAVGLALLCCRGCSSGASAPGWRSRRS